MRRVDEDTIVTGEVTKVIKISDLEEQLRVFKEAEIKANEISLWRSTLPEEMQEFVIIPHTFPHVIEELEKKIQEYKAMQIDG